MKGINETVKRCIKETGTSIEYAALMAFISVESGGKGFGSDGRVLIQFEPVWFKRLQPYAPSGGWSVNKVDVQSKEWEAFLDACKVSNGKAIEATSLGLPQILGLHYKRLGFISPYQMFNAFSDSLDNQIKGLIRFIETDKRLLNAIVIHNWTEVAEIYNGIGFLEIAKKYGRVPYDIAMVSEYSKFKKEET